MIRENPQDYLFNVYIVCFNQNINPNFYRPLRKIILFDDINFVL